MRTLIIVIPTIPMTISGILSSGIRSCATWQLEIQLPSHKASYPRRTESPTSYAADTRTVNHYYSDYISHVPVPVAARSKA